MKIYPFIQRFLFIFLACCLLPSCDWGNRNLDSLSDGLNKIGDKVEPYTERVKKVPEMAEEEYEKLFRFEYQVVELSLESNATKLQETLAELGKERWECFHVQPKDEKLLVFCKKRPVSYLRYLGHLW